MTYETVVNLLSLIMYVEIFPFHLFLLINVFHRSEICDIAALFMPPLGALAVQKKIQAVLSRFFCTAGVSKG